jgi:hypothetical protein
MCQSIFWHKGRSGLPTLDNAFAFQPYFKPAAHEDKVIRNTISVNLFVDFLSAMAFKSVRANQ